MTMSGMTHQEIKEYIGHNNRTLIIPVGTCEQHGHHLPIDTDTVCAEYFAARLSGQVGALVAPTINYGVNLPVDRPFTGTAGVTCGLLRGQLDELLGWWRAQGFDRFVIITYHGDPFHERALEDLGGDALLIRAYDIDYSGILTRQRGVEHACEAETSVMLYLRPESVKIERALDEEIELPDHDEYLYHRKSELPEGYLEKMTGASGYPRAATREKGGEIIRRSVEMMLSEYRRFAGRTAESI